MNIIKNIWLHVKYSKILNKIYKDEDLLNKMSELLGVKVKKDWVGRIYMVLNPNLLPKEEQIFEYGENGLNNSSFIEKWLMERFIIMEKFLMVNNLFDILSYSIKRIDDYENYLLIIEPVTFKEYIKSLKYLFILIILSLIICIGYFKLT